MTGTGNVVMSASPTLTGTIGAASQTLSGTLGVTGATTLSSTLGVTGVSTFAAGSAAAPALTTTGDTNTGIFFPAADTIAFAEGGAEAMRIDSSGNVGIGTSSPSYRLDVQSTSDTKLIITGSTNQNGMRFGAAGAANEYYVAAGNNLVGGGDKGFLIYNSTAGHPVLFIEQSTKNVSVYAALSVTGALSKGSGSFRIEHPLPSKSVTHQLVHSFIEGPKCDLIYRGKVDLVDGKASVNIDTDSTMTEGTFEVLCATVQCFTSNESGWGAIRGKVVGNILTIEAQDAASTDNVSWMVIGERKDKHIMDIDWTDKDGRPIVEPLKPF
jgi:hypothetical protein